MRSYLLVSTLLVLTNTFVGMGCSTTGKKTIFVPTHNEVVDCSVLGKQTNGVIVVSKDVNLHGSSCDLPEGCTLLIEGGSIRNGILVGNQNKIRCGEKSFDRVTFKGSWNVPIIKTSMFADLSYENALKDVMALTNPDVANNVYIDKGEYQLSVEKKQGAALVVNNNTNLIIEGTLKLLPNNFRGYSILHVSGENITIRGKGEIIGDRDKHTGDSGEWGMGINILGASNVLIQDLTISKCWGDCIYVGNNSNGVTIDNCILDGSRRQGISITSGSGILIHGGIIRNIAGTSPEYAIDVEPNSNESVRNVVIDGVEIDNCRGGITTNGRAQGSKLESVVIKNCHIHGIKFHAPLWFKATEYVEIADCEISIDIIKFAFRFTNVNHGVVKRNHVYAKRFFMEPCPNVEITDNVIQCGGFYTDTPNAGTLKNVKIEGNSFMKRIPELPLANQKNKMSVNKNEIVR